MKGSILHRYFIFLSVLLLFSGDISAQLQEGWLQRASLPGPARHRSVCVNIGSRIYIGLGHVNAVVDILYDDWWEFDPGANSWTQKASYAGGLRHHGFGFVINNKAYVGMGRAPGNALPRDNWEYDPTTNVWIGKSLFPGNGRRGSVSFSIGNKGYMGTGNTASGYTSDFWEYDAAGDFWIQRAFFPPGARFACVGFSIGTKGYIGTGEQSTAPSGSKNDLWEYNPATNSWLQRANVPGPARLAACGFSLAGKGYIGTGEDFQSGNNFSDFHKYDPTTNTWVQINDFTGIARRYMVGTSCGVHAFVGTGTNGTNYQDWWEFGYLSGESESESYAGMINFYPNPAVYQTTLYIDKGVDVQNATLHIFDMSGKNVRSIPEITGNAYTLECEDMQTGTYIYSLRSNTSVIASGKLIIAK